MSRPGHVRFRLLNYLWNYKLTRGGRFLAASIAVSAMLSASSGLAPTYAITFVLFLIGFFSFVFSWEYRLWKAELSCTLPGRAMAGTLVRGRVRVRNLARRRWWTPNVAFEIGARLSALPSALKDLSHDEIIRMLAPGESGELPIALAARRRGVYSLGELRVFTTFPLNLFRTGSVRLALAPLMVVPRFSPLEGLDLPVGRLYQPGGFALTTNLGDSPEYVGNRNYVPGDSVRRIDSRAWARLGHPAVREFQEEYYCRIALVLDTFVAPRRRERRDEGFAELEAAISLAAAVADALTRGEYILDLFAAGPELYTFRAGQNLAHLDNVLEILACVEACRTNPFEKVAPALAGEAANISTVVCVFLDWDASRRRLVRSVEEVGCRVKVVIVREGETSEPLGFGEFPDVALYTPAEVAAGKVVRV